MEDSLHKPLTLWCESHYFEYINWGTGRSISFSKCWNTDWKRSFITSTTLLSLHLMMFLWVERKWIHTKPLNLTVYTSASTEALHVLWAFLVILNVWTMEWSLRNANKPIFSTTKKDSREKLSSDYRPMQHHHALVKILESMHRARINKQVLFHLHLARAGTKPEDLHPNIC